MTARHRTQFLRRSARGLRDERGSTLLLALMIVLVVAIAGTAVLNQVSNAPAAQKVYSGVRTVQLNADQAADTVVQSMRNVRAAGVAGSGGTCSNTASFGSSIATISGYDVYCKADPNSGVLQGVAPNAPTTSILTLGGQGDAYAGDLPNSSNVNLPYPTTAAPGYARASSVIAGNDCTSIVGGLCSAPKLASDNKSPNPTYWSSFCNDFHDFQSTGTSPDRCEAGIFIGRSVNDDTTTTTACTVAPCAAGLLIKNTGSLDSSQPLVISNSSIIASNINGVHHELDVAGSIWARADCGWGAGVNQPTFANHVYADWSALSPKTKDLQCQNNTGYNSSSPFSSDNPTQSTASEAARKLVPDPDYVHEPIDLTQVPIVNASAPDANCTAKGGNAAEQLTSPWAQQRCSGNTCWDPTATNPITNAKTGWNSGSCQLSTSLCQNGFLIMPAKELMQNDGTPYLQNGDPVFAAWYDDGTDLNTMMSGCGDSLIWFRPGVYYFDFRDFSDGSDTHQGISWTAAKGCWPINTGCTGPDELVGGMPQGWTACASASKADVIACQQPEKVMTPGSFTKVNGGTWQLISRGSAIDDKSTETDINPANPKDTVEWNNLQTSIPEDITPTDAGQNIQSVTSFKIEVAYNAPGDANNQTAIDRGLPLPDDPANFYSDVPSDDYHNGAGPELQLTMPGGPLCYIHLPLGAHGAFDKDHAGTTPPVTIDLSRGCSPATINKNINDPLNRVVVDHAGASFPCGDSSDWPSQASLWPSGVAPAVPGCAKNIAAGQQTFASRPDDINQMKFDFVAQTPNAAPEFVNGLDVKVSWIGRPSPAFPGGCDRTKAGTQFILGGYAKINWTADGTHNMFAELCASKQSSFPNWDNDPACAADPNGAACFNVTTNPKNGQDFGIAIYGMTEDAANALTYPQTLNTSDTNDPTTDSSAMPTTTAGSQGTSPPSASYSYDTTNSTTTGAIWTNTDGSSPGKTSNWANPSATPASNPGKDELSALFYQSSWQKSTLSYNLPTNLVGSGPNQIPPGSTITHASMTAYHREGDWNETTPGACGTPVITNTTFWAKGNASNPNKGVSPTERYYYTTPISSADNTAFNAEVTALKNHPGNGSYYFLVNIGGVTPVSWNQQGALVSNVGSDAGGNYFDVLETGVSPGAFVSSGWVVMPLPKTLPTGCTLKNVGDFGAVNVKITPANSNSYGSDAFKSQIWLSAQNSVNHGNGIPPCTDYTAQPVDPPNTSNEFPTVTGQTTDYPPGKNLVTGYAKGACPFTWGNINSTMDAPDSTGEDYTAQRDLTDSLNSPEAWSGANVQWQLTQVATNSAVKEADFMGIVFEITYRTTSQPRPLAGCTTTRAMWPNGDLVPDNTTVGFKGIAQAARGYDWLDSDWGSTRTGANYTALTPDDAYGNDSASPGGTGGLGDTNDCALMYVGNTSGRFIKFHANGMLYAPSAAMELSGNDNDASWSTDGIVVRHLSALRWINNGDVAAVGDDPQPRNNRMITIEVCPAGSNCTSGSITLKELVVIDDQHGDDIGHAIDTVSTQRNL